MTFVLSSISKKKKKAKERGSQIITKKSNKSRWVLGKKPKPQN